MLLRSYQCALSHDDNDRSPTDAGDTPAEGGWTEVTCPVSTHLRRVGFMSPNEGWIVGESGTILRSRVQGDSWSVVQPGLTDEYL